MIDISLIELTGLFFINQLFCEWFEVLQWIFFLPTGTGSSDSIKKQPTNEIQSIFCLL